ncbi:MAG TPA: YtxH domain-containing protein [Gemmatimonadaceae bacterium]|nr:YtxH domain-containing protein [Gemmatimonadaceae bacterium]
MSDYDWDEEPYVVIERNEPGVSAFLAGLAVGAGIALLFAPRTGAETRRDLQQRARRVGDQAQDFVSEVTDSVGQKIEEARSSVQTRIETTRDAIELKRRQVTRAVDAGRAAAQQSRVELEQRIAETKAAYKES